MFLDELTPIFKELVQQPIAFMGGFVSGVLRLKITEEPLATWLEKQGGVPASYTNPVRSEDRNSGPQSISID